VISVQGKLWRERGKAPTTLKEAVVDAVCLAFLCDQESRKPVCTREVCRVCLVKCVRNNMNEQGAWTVAAKQSMAIMACVCLIVTLTMVSSIHATESSDVRGGFYFGVLFVQNNMSGDFDDSGFLVSSSDLYDVPDLGDGTGFGVVAGWRDARGAIELGYQRSMHDTRSSFVDIGDSEASYNVVDLNLKLDVFQKADFLARHRIRPYLLLGFGIPGLTIEDSATDGSSLEDETFIGFSLNAGAGVAYCFHPQWAVTGGVIHRWNWFRSVEGEDIDDSLKE